MKTWKKLAILLLATGITGCVNDNDGKSPLATPLDTTYLHKFTHFKIRMEGVYDQIMGDGKDTLRNSGFLFSVGNFDYHSPLKWSHYSFTTDTTLSYTTNPEPPDYRNDYGYKHVNYIFSGTISEDNTIEGSADRKYESKWTNHNGWTYENEAYELELKYKDIPIATQLVDTLTFSLQGNPLQSNILSFSYKKTQPNPSTVQNFVWDTVPRPTLTITLYKQ